MLFGQPSWKAGDDDTERLTRLYVKTDFQVITKRLRNSGTSLATGKKDFHPPAVRNIVPPGLRQAGQDASQRVNEDWLGNYCQNSSSNSSRPDTRRTG